MPVKINISFTPDEEATADRIADRIKPILPRHKVKKSTGTPPYKQIYFKPTKAEKSTKYGDNA